jgi:hypothetical protein
MTPFEDELRKALSRHEPSPGFTDRVLAQTEQPEKPQERPWFFSWRLASLAATLVLLVFGLFYRHQERMERGEAAKQQLLLAIRIAGSELHQAQARVKRIPSPEVEMQ